MKRAAQNQSGFTLIELMVVSMLLSVVLIAIFTLAETSERIAPNDQERAHAIRDAQVGLHSMTRELRQAYELVSTTPYSMDVRVVVNGEDRRVVYKCDEPHPDDPSFDRCVRWEVLAGGPTPKTPVVERLVGAPAEPVFDYVVNGGRVTYVKATIEVPASGGRKDGHPHRVILDDGFFMRNVAL